MNWSELEDIIIDSKCRLNSILRLFDWEKGDYKELPPDEAIPEDVFGENGAVKDVTKVWDNVTDLCNYMFADGKIDITNDLLDIRAMADELKHKSIKHKSRGRLAIACDKVVKNIDLFLNRWGNNHKPQPKVLFSDLFPEESKVYFKRLVDAGFCSADYLWNNGTKYQAAHAAYHISVLTWGRIKWQPFEKLWGLSKMAQTFSNNRIQANQDSINKIDNLFRDNNPKKDLYKLD